MPPLPTTRAKPSPGRESPTISLELTTLNLFVELKYITFILSEIWPSLLRAIFLP